MEAEQHYKLSCIWVLTRRRQAEGQVSGALVAAFPRPREAREHGPQAPVIVPPRVQRVRRQPRAVQPRPPVDLAVLRRPVIALRRAETSRAVRAKILFGCFYGITCCPAVAPALSRGSHVVTLEIDMVP